MKVKGKVRLYLHRNAEHPDAAAWALQLEGESELILAEKVDVHDVRASTATDDEGPLKGWVELEDVELRAKDEAEGAELERGKRYSHIVVTRARKAPATRGDHS